MLDRRSDLLNSASGKLEAVRGQVADKPLTKTLFYCANRLQMGAVSDVLRGLGHIPPPFTAEESREMRADVLTASPKVVRLLLWP